MSGKTTDLKKFEDERGSLLHILRSDAPHFKGFGEVYISTVNPGVVKGWRKHKKMTQNYAVPCGEVKVVLFDESSNETSEYTLSRDHYQLLTIPPGIWYSFKAISKTEGMIINCTDLPHDPDETESKDLNDSSIPYTWE